MILDGPSRLCLMMFAFPSSFLAFPSPLITMALLGGSRGRGGGDVGRGGSIRPGHSKHAGSSCYEPVFEVFNSLKNYKPAQDWCYYNWPQPEVTETCTVDEAHPTPTTIMPPKAKKPNDHCPKHEPLCALYEKLVKGEYDSRDKGSDIWWVEII